LVVGAVVDGVVELVELFDVAGALVAWAIRATPEIARANIRFFMAFLLGGFFVGLHSNRRGTPGNGS
jgi:hypothetical protein